MGKKTKRVKGKLNRVRRGISVRDKWAITAAMVVLELFASVTLQNLLDEWLSMNASVVYGNVTQVREYLNTTGSGLIPTLLFSLILVAGIVFLVWLWSGNEDSDVIKKDIKEIREGQKKILALLNTRKGKSKKK